MSQAYVLCFEQQTALVQRETYSFNGCASLSLSRLLLSGKVNLRTLVPFQALSGDPFNEYMIMRNEKSQPFSCTSRARSKICKIKTSSKQMVPSGWEHGHDGKSIESLALRACVRAATQQSPTRAGIDRLLCYSTDIIMTIACSLCSITLLRPLSFPARPLTHTLPLLSSISPMRCSRDDHSLLCLSPP